MSNRFTKANHIIAVFEACATDNTEYVKVCVREWPFLKEFEVFVDGGLLSDGTESAMAYNLREALELASREVASALEGD